MKLLILEYLCLTVVFFTLLYFGVKKRRVRGIIPVKDLRHLCKSEFQEKLYDELLKKGIYVSPSLQFGYCSIPIALEQYQVAVFDYPKKKWALIKRLILKHKELYLRSLGWKVVKISSGSVSKDFEAVVSEILKQVENEKKA